MAVALTVFGISWLLIAYTYVGFPLLLALWAKLFGERCQPSGGVETDAWGISGSAEAESPGMPRVAMVVAAFNEEAVLEAKLTNSWAIDYPADRFELWIGSDGSSDRTDEIVLADSDPRLKYRPFTERRGKISVLNDLMAEIDADIVVFSDANTIYAPDAVKLLVARFADPRVGCVSGELTITQNGGVSGEGLYWKYESWIKRNESRLGFLIGCNGGIFALRRECYAPLPSSTIVEDFVLTMRVLESGYRVVFAPEAQAWEPPCISARAEMIRKVRIGAGGYQALGLTGRLLLPGFGMIAAAFWGHKVLRWLVPFFYLIGLGANAYLSTIPVFAAILGLQAAGALSSLLAYDIRTSHKMPRFTRPISYFYLMNYSLFCGFLRFVTKTQRVTWDRHARPAAARFSSGA